eukprot:1157733-Pelagomonas_calceolata.AAC.5
MNICAYAYSPCNLANTPKYACRHNNRMNIQANAYSPYNRMNICAYAAASQHPCTDQLTFPAHAHLQDLFCAPFCTAADASQSP